MWGEISEVYMTEKNEDGRNWSHHAVPWQSEGMKSRFESLTPCTDSTFYQPAQNQYVLVENWLLPGQYRYFALKHYVLETTIVNVTFSACNALLHLTCTKLLGNVCLHMRGLTRTESNISLDSIPLNP